MITNIVKIKYILNLTKKLKYLNSDPPPSIPLYVITIKKSQPVPRNPNLVD